MHSCYACGALLCPFFIAAAGRVSGSFAVLVLAVLGLLLWLVYMGTPFAGKSAGKKEVTDWSFLKSTRFWLLTGLLFCQNAAEQSVTGWMVTYFKGSGIIAGTLAAYTVTVMWGATLVARLLIAFVFPFKSPRKAMVGMSVLCTIFYVLLVMAHTQVMAIVLLFAFAFSMAGLFLLSACSRPAAEETETAEMTAAAESTQETSGVLVIEDAGEDKNKTISVRIVDSSNPALPGREAKKVRGIYITGPVAGNEEVLNGVLDGALTAGINAVVIDFKEDQGRITCPVDAATVNEIGASIPYVRDMKSLIESLKKKDLYVIARVAAFRGFLSRGQKKPEWSLNAGRKPCTRPPGECTGWIVPPGGLGLSSGSRNRGKRSRL